MYALKKVVTVNNMSIKASLSNDELAQLVEKQLNHFFPDTNDDFSGVMLSIIEASMPRLEHAFSHINNKYFFDNKKVVFDHLHGDQYAMLLYLLSNQAFRMGESSTISKKLFLLNKALHGCDIYYEVELPEIFILVHPLGTVLGRGEYSDYFMVYQRCGIGSNHDIYPTLGKYLTLRPGSSVLGKCIVEDNCCLASDALLLDSNLKENSLYIGNPKKSWVRSNANPQHIWRV